MVMCFEQQNMEKHHFLTFEADLYRCATSVSVPQSADLRGLWKTQINLRGELEGLCETTEVPSAFQHVLSGTLESLQAHSQLCEVLKKVQQEP